jgi:hypothetical protein
LLTISSSHLSTSLPRPTKPAYFIEKKPLSITVYQYGLKPDPGTTFFLTKTKYPTWKQIDQALLTFQPFWKPKIMFAFVDKKLKRVKGMDGLVEGGKYLCIAVEEFAEYDVGKVPGGFFV